jgi:hypothetical protein
MIDPKNPASSRIASGMVAGSGLPLVAHPLQTIKSLYNTVTDADHPNESAADQIGRGLKSAYQGAKTKVADIRQNGIAPTLERGVGEAGGMLATGGLLKGAASAVNAVPRIGRAGEMFNSLNTDLADTPVPLIRAAQPLQRVTEIGERGSTLPTSVNKLLLRSQMTEPMTFPEARDYQGSLSDLSASDKLAMNGRVRGGVAQLNKGLYGDVFDAANKAGRGEDYANAMKEYRQAAQIRNGLKTAGKIAIGGAVAGGIGAPVYQFLKGVGR